MIQLIQQILEFIGWQRFISTDEFTVALWAWALGGLVTEAIKRLAHGFGFRGEPIWVYPLTGFLLTFFTAALAWPPFGRFPHPVLAALTIGAALPVAYKIVTVVLRRVGLGRVAAILTGNRRTEESKRKLRIERRRETAP